MFIQSLCSTSTEFSMGRAYIIYEVTEIKSTCSTKVLISCLTKSSDILEYVTKTYLWISFYQNKTQSIVSFILRFLFKVFGTSFPFLPQQKIQSPCNRTETSNENIFTKSIPMYQHALQKSGFTEQIKYITRDNNRENNTEEKKRCKRKIIWFNPPYSMNVRTNMGNTFLKLMRKHYLNGNPLHKIFNKNSSKVSYSCMCKMASIISSHNRTILNPDVSTEYGCNCR